MIEGLPWGVQLGFAGGGWALVVAFVWMVFTGRVVTRREVDGLEKRMGQEVDLWRAAEGVRSKQLSALMDATGTSTKFIEAAVRQVIRDHPEDLT